MCGVREYNTDLKTVYFCPFGMYFISKSVESVAVA